MSNAESLPTDTDILDSGRVTVVRENYLTVSIGCTTYGYDYGSDYVWRLTMVDCYGNRSFVSGAGCDASGRVVADMDVMGRLDEFVTFA